MQSFRLPARRRALGIALILALPLSAWGRDQRRGRPAQDAAQIRLASGAAVPQPRSSCSQPRRRLIFGALMPYDAHQFNERACSVASTTMILNGLRAQVELTTSDELITQGTLLKHVCFPEWARAVSPDGDSVTIEELGEYIRESLKHYGPNEYEVQAVRRRSERQGLARAGAANADRERKIGRRFRAGRFLLPAVHGRSRRRNRAHRAPLAAYDADLERR